MWKLLPAALLLTTSASTRPGPAIGQPAPTFVGLDSHGHRRSLAAYRGKWVVLEWFNPDCPYTRKHYNSANMQRLQREYTNRGVVWLSIQSSGPGHDGYMSAAETNAFVAKQHASATAVLRDTSGTIGRLYGATNTPNMFVIDPHGTLVYAGAIDDKRTTDTADVVTAHNYVRAALDAAMAGKPVDVPLTQPYGCIIEYATPEHR